MLFDLENIISSFNENMKKISSLRGIDPKEKIYSARFVDGKAYIVTFRMIDPLFVVDIKNPSMMKILGQLKIPGYSNYLHPSINLRSLPILKRGRGLV